MLKSLITKEQLKVLEGISYRIADIAYMKEKFGPNEPEIEVSRKTLSSLFYEADMLNIPFWVQNQAIAFGSDWREYLKSYTRKALEEANIKCS